jgi:hypothetical protein
MFFVCMEAVDPCGKQVFGRPTHEWDDSMKMGYVN